MVDDDLLEPAKGYPHLRERVLKEAEKIFDGLVKDANVNLPNNDSTCDKYYEKEKEIEEVGKTLGKKKALKGFCIFLTIAFFVAAIVGIFGIANSWNMGLCIGLLAGGLGAGFVLAIFLANSGGAWDNAKKYVEEGHFGGKGSVNHHATVVGDTVGDPFKDTSGPSLNILIKLMSMVSIVMAGLTVMLH